MSYKAQQWVLELTDVRGVDKWVLFMLAYRDNHEPPHGCFPSLARLAQDCGFSRSTVQACIDRLKASDKVRVNRRRDSKGDADSNYYTLPQVYRESVHPYRESVQGVADGGTGVYRQPVTNLKTTLIKPKSGQLSQTFDYDHEGIHRCLECRAMVVESRAAMRQHTYRCAKRKATA